MLGQILLAILLAAATLPKASMQRGQPLKILGCHQSSEFESPTKRCDKAYDGNANQYWSGDSCTATAESEQGWWTASIEDKAHIRQIRIYNRLDCCGWRLNHFVIEVDGHQCASYNSLTSFSVKTFQCNRVGQVVTIKSLIKEQLSLCEVKVYGEYVSHPGSQLKLSNCQQKTTASSTFICKNAIDGINSVSNYLDCSYTSGTDQGWWRAQTDQVAHIREVQIFSWHKRMYNFLITVDGRQCVSYNSTIGINARSFECNRIGQQVTIDNLVIGYLSLCEVRVFGEFIAESPKFIGCFVDSSKRDLPHLAGNGAMTVAKCNTLCSENQFAYFGLQDGNDCWCGHSYGERNKRPANECNMTCSGDNAEICGASWRNSIYLIGLIASLQ